MFIYECKFKGSAWGIILKVGYEKKVQWEKIKISDGIFAKMGKEAVLGNA